MPAMRFTIDENFLASGREYEANRCFCVIPPEPDQQSDVDEVEHFNVWHDTTECRRHARPCITPAVCITQFHVYLPEICQSVALCWQEDQAAASKRKRRDAAMSVEEKELQSCLPKGAMDISKCSGITTESFSISMEVDVLMFCLFVLSCVYGNSEKAWLLV